ESDEARDAAMTEASDEDIAWVRPTGSKRHSSGTAQNLQRREQARRERDREARKHFPRYIVDDDCLEVPILRVSAEPVAPLGHEDSRDYERAVPLPLELVERLRAAREARAAAERDLHACEQEVRLWQSRQENDPV